PAYAHGLAALQLAAGRAGRAFEALADRGGEFERYHEPLLFPALDPAELDFLVHAIDELHGAGSSQPLEQVSPAELPGLGPALSPDLLGGMIAYDEGRVRPEGLTAGVHRALVARGVEVIEGIPVTRLTRDDREWIAETPTGPHRAQAVVIAGGVDSARLLAA